MFCKITSVKALENYTLLIGFDDGKKCIYDILPLCEKFEVFRDLKTIKGLFEQVKIEPKGYALAGIPVLTLVLMRFILVAKWCSF
ncbi:DUF2442 domain-containing protein [Campylobacter sp.]|uniref:DUF2442 domain-containing protein n=1 Tax=Campylobacter sp. TaxID=205 RepID=UPI002A82E3D1|nr:DUF2442 domain-containing protein [Campylobacter sp.]MDY4154175.1 DUF2442 domain-containing protein [Campylobacter sp.]